MVQDLYKQKRSLELRWQLEYQQEGKYTLDMVKIDNAIRDVITEIKLEESKIANRENAINDAAPEVSVATQVNATSLKSHFSLGSSCTLLKIHI